MNTYPGTDGGARVDRHRRAAVFSVFSANALRIELWLYAEPFGADVAERVMLSARPRGWWSAEIPLVDLPATRSQGVVYYGYRAWGPNWRFEPSWRPGSLAGFVCDVDDEGNRFNPNKLLFDPRARELSHDPQPCLSDLDPERFLDAYYSGRGWRELDTGRIAPKSLLVSADPGADPGVKPRRALKDDVVYEVHVRGLTKLDLSLPPEIRGTYRGAGTKASYLKALGVTAIELLPVFHFASEQNDDGDPRGDNYWGYMPLGWFAPNRRYAADRSAGGPTREFKAMVKAFHDAGIKVILDVVYNHTGEGGLRSSPELRHLAPRDEVEIPSQACLLSLRGLDNATYYTLRSRPDLDGGRLRQRYQDNSCCGPNLNVTHPAVKDLILDSLLYWSRDMGVDGFRFDLASILGNHLPAERFEFSLADPGSLLLQMGRILPLRRDQDLVGVDLIAEPWALGEGTYQLGRFPDGWAEWNDAYRNTLRDAENKLGIYAVAPGRIASAVSGSPEQFQSGGTRLEPRPWSSVNYVVSHDGFTLKDLYSTTGGDRGWDHGGDPARQRQACRNAFTLLMTSAGVPMLVGGDELLRSQGGRENPYAIDDESVYLDFRRVHALEFARSTGDPLEVERAAAHDDVRMLEFVRAVIALRARFETLRPNEYFTGRARGRARLKDITWYGANGAEFVSGWEDPRLCFLGYRFDTSQDASPTRTHSLYVAYNWHAGPIDVTMPPNLPGRCWFRFLDTAEWFEPQGNIDAEGTLIERHYGLHGRAVAVFLEKGARALGIPGDRGVA